MPPIRKSTNPDEIHVYDNRSAEPFILVGQNATGAPGGCAETHSASNLQKSLLTLPKAILQTMTTLQIPVPETTAQQYSRLSNEQKNALSALITDSLTETTDLLDVMDYISFKAAKRGLTQDKLNELLAN